MYPGVRPICGGPGIEGVPPSPTKARCPRSQDLPEPTTRDLANGTYTPRPPAVCAALPARRESAAVPDRSKFTALARNPQRPVPTRTGHRQAEVTCPRLHAGDGPETQDRQEISAAMPSRRELANAIRALAMDAVQRARSGHPGMPMGMADIAQVLWNDHLRHDPSDPDWPDRDRFVVSNGHGSMLLYALLHLSGYALPLDEIKRFRQHPFDDPGTPRVRRCTRWSRRRPDRSGRAWRTRSGWRSRRRSSRRASIAPATRSSTTARGCFSATAA